MTEVYITFRSLTRAQLAAETLARSGIDAHILRAPEPISRQGCGYALLVYRTYLSAAIYTLRQNGTGFERVFSRSGSRRFQEIRI